MNELALCAAAVVWVTVFCVVTAVGLFRVYPDDN
jgi:hypothetical protein